MARYLPVGHQLLFIVTLLVSSSCFHRGSSAGADPTTGFVAVELTEDQLKLHKPYDLAPEQRYQFRGGERRMWVLATDKPLKPGSDTKPRSEIRVNETYSSGVWQFEGYAYVPPGTTGVSIMQVFGAPPASGRSTTLMLHVYGGRLMYYNDEARVVDPDIWGRWFRLNVVHDVGGDRLTVFVDGEERLAVAGRGRYQHYFKFGVYTQSDPSYYMESRWRDVKVYTKVSGQYKKQPENRM